MSSANPYSPTQTIDDSPQANIETALRITTIMVEASGRLFRLQSEAANAAFAENSKHLTTLLDTLNSKDSAALVAEWTRLYQANLRRVLDVTRSCFEIVPQTRTEIAKLMGDPFASASKETQQYLDRVTQAMSDGRNAAAASMQDFLGKGSPGVSGTQPAKKEKVT